jgi:hypothetical protein
MAGLAVVHRAVPISHAADAPAAQQAAAEKSSDIPFTGKLPANVADMRDAILAAVQTGHIEELRVAIEWNELKPDFGEAPGSDPIAHLKTVSGDGAGREVLAVLGQILALAPARLSIGRDVENNAVYVWPYLSELPLHTLSPAQEVELYGLVSPSAANLMSANNKWLWWRIAIGADGTWHTFRKFSK